MPAQLNIPITDSAPLAISIQDHSRLFIIGPNGAGKSALMQHSISSLGRRNIRRISAHRQTWLESGAINMTPMTRQRFGNQQATQQAEPDSRWVDKNPGGQISSVLYDLVAKDNDQARRITAQARAKNHKEIDRIVDQESGVFDEVNHLLALAGLDVAIENSKGEELLCRRKGHQQAYNIAQMSDGERNAVILAANVLTVDDGIVLLLDEPERHLHRSIIEPFLTALFAQRPNCPFLVATHEVNLPLANPEASVLIIRSCKWAGANAESWDATLIDGDAHLPDDIKRAILGARNSILFVEGQPQSLDSSLYQAMFPHASIIPVGSCDDVIKTVDGLRNTEQHHDVRAFGLIDGDNRNPEDHPKLIQRGIHPLSSCSVESIYYCTTAINAVASRQAESLLLDPDQIAKSAKQAALDALRKDGVAERMAARRSERKVRQQAQLQMPSWQAIANEEDYTITLKPSEWYQMELSRFQKLIDEDDLDGLIARYPIRETDVIDRIVSALHLKNSKTYRDTLTSRIHADSGLADDLRQYTGSLTQEFLSAQP